MRDDAIYEYGVEGYAMTHTDCFLAVFSDRPCSGRMEKAHLVRQQTIRREVWKKRPDLQAEFGAMNGAGTLIWDERCWRPACHQHHVMLDHARTLRVPRSAIPADTEQYAAEYGLGWWLDRTYGERQVAA